ncbi:MAG: hypothetical protein JXR59_02610 [Desulfuromonadaceae bacterium]|nr:hypothetical protein [Desulfuromonadaceae bacterium]
MEKVPHSQTGQPDLDWSQVRETVLMLNLAVAQLEKTMTDGEESVNTLTDTFAALIGRIQAISRAAENLPETAETTTILGNVEPAVKQVNRAIIAFQFYDKLSQRLAHVSNSLTALGKLIEEPARLYNPYEWYGLQAMIKSKYTIEQDRQMFEAILAGASLEEVLSASPADATQNPEGEIELF